MRERERVCVCVKLAESFTDKGCSHLSNALGVCEGLKLHRSRV